MPPLFAPSSWNKKTNVPMSTTSALVSPDGALIATGASAFVGGAPTEWFVNTCAITRNQAFSWQTMPNENSENYGPFFVIENNLDTRYFRIRIKFGRSFFIANSTIFPGYLKIDQSLDGMNWSETQTIHTWPHLVDTIGAGGQAQLTVGATYIFIPGSGPAGADADWLLIRCRVSSAQGTPVDKFEWYRSDDFGFTWNFVRDETAVQFGGQVPFFMLRSLNGRIAAGNAGMFFSNDNGATWTTSGGALPPQLKTGATRHQGNTLCCYMPGGVGTTVNTGISCDAGANWGVTGSPPLGGTNTNVAALEMGLVEALAMCGNGTTGASIWYTNTGGETWSLQGTETRLPAGQASVVGMGFFPNGAPVVIGANGVVLVSGDRPSGFFGPRSFCPFANAGLKRAGIPDNCGHPILTRCD